MKLLSDRNITVTTAHAVHSTFANDPRVTCTHTRAVHGIMLRLGGNTRYTLDDRVIDSRPGDLMLLTRGMRYSLSNRAGGECFVVNFSTLTDYEPEVYRCHPRSTGRFDELFRRAIRCENEKSTAGKKAALYEILALTQRIAAAEYCPDSRARTLEPAMAAFREGLDRGDALSVAQLADRCGISETSFRQLFTAAQGMNPAQYFLALRIDAAKRRLHEGGSIADAAEAAGFADASYFTKAFRRVTGMLPREYQREFGI